MADKNDKPQSARSGVPNRATPAAKSTTSAGTTPPRTTALRTSVGTPQSRQTAPTRTAATGTEKTPPRTTAGTAQSRQATPARTAATPTRTATARTSAGAAQDKQTTAPRTAQARTASATRQSSSSETAAAKTATATGKPTARQSVGEAVAESARRQAEAAAAADKKAAEKQKESQAKEKNVKPAAKQTERATENKSARGGVKKAERSDKSGGGRSGGGVIAAIKNNKKQSIIIAAIAFALILALVLGLVFGLKSCSGSGDGVVDLNPVSELDRYDPATYKTNTAVGFYGEVLGTVEPKKPVAEIKDESAIYGNAEYPKYGQNLNSVLGSDADKQAARSKLIQESSYLTTSNTWNGGGGGYKWMDKDGYLFSGSTAEPQPTTYSNGVQRQLYKHVAAEGLYGGNVSDSEPRIIKRVKMRPRGYTGYGVTGVYAPAGEVIRIDISEADMNATGGIEIHIGQALYNGKANNIWTAKNQMQRFPILLNTMIVDKTTSVYNEETKTYTAYVGSFIGGPLYIRNEGSTFTATISGGVAYSHFILGYTTQKEFEENAKSSAPYFDLEVWNYGVLLSGPKSQADGLSYDDLYKAAVLWDKVSSVTTTGSLQGIVFLFDPFVAAGAAVAFPGQMSVNCPVGWMRQALNYNQLVTSGAWGNFHEYHHNFQGYGVGNGGEVTNNGMTLVSYALFTKISANRGMLNFGAQGLGGWNDYTSAPWALEQTLKIVRPDEAPGNGNQGLALYATLLHNFGPDAYIQSKVRQRGQRYGESYTGYMKAWQDITHNNMSYYFNDILCGNVAASNAASEYPMFVPVSSVFQTGRSYMYDGQKKYITTMQPYVIPYGKAFTVDLRKYTANNGQYSYGSIVLPNGFTYQVKNITQPENGKFERSAPDGVYVYTPDPQNKNLNSGKIYVTLGITKDDGAFVVDDVDLVLEFNQSQEFNKMELTRTTYTYSQKVYSDAEEAYNAGFAGYAEKSEIVHTNPTQNCNTDIWYWTDTDKNHNDHPDAPDHYFVKENSIAVIDGKLYAEEGGKYRIFLRGRLNCALYYSVDGGNTYKRGAFIKDENASTSTASFRPNDANTYFDLDLDENSWVFIKEVLICCTVDQNRASFIGVGMQHWTKPMFTMVDKYYDANGKEVSSPDDPNYFETKTHYYNYLGIEVDEDVANNAELIPPDINKNNQPYVNAYRNTYEIIHQEFTTDYFYTRKYTYNYRDNLWQNKEQTILQSKYNRAPDNWGWGRFPESNLIDGNRNTWIHTSGNVSESNPLQFVIDMGEVRPVNRMIIYSQNRGDLQVPRSFTLMGSVDGSEGSFFEVGAWTDAPNSGATVTVDFEEKSFRYYILTVTKSSGGYIIMSEIEMWRAFEVNGGAHITPDDERFTYGSDWYGAKADSSFGHIYVGNKNAEMSFEFEGTRLGILSSTAYGRSFEVYIDGQKADSIQLKADDSPTTMTYMSQPLSEGKHRVVIKCVDQANIDSVVIFD